jgi:hypothetical protein
MIFILIRNSPWPQEFLPAFLIQELWIPRDHRPHPKRVVGNTGYDITRAALLRGTAPRNFEVFTFTVVICIGDPSVSRGAIGFGIFASFVDVVLAKERTFHV